MNNFEAHEFIRSRQSVREFSGQKVSNEIIDRVLETVRWAPSAHNRQPWRFVVLAESAYRQKLVDAMYPAYRKALTEAGLEPDIVEKKIMARSNRMVEAPLAFLVCCAPDDMDRYPDDPERDAGEQTMGIQSVALAAGTLLLAAHAEGLGAVWMCAPMFVQEEVCKAFDLENTWQPQALILCGFPKDQLSSEQSRKRLDEIIFYPDDED